MNIALWIVQVLVGGFFVFHMTIMLRPPRQARRPGMTYIAEMSPSLRLFAGIAEGAAGIALVVAGFIHPVAWLVWLAAVGLVVLMAGAIVFHLRRREYPNIGLNAVLLLLSSFVAYGRLVLAPF